jgi:hypothetical protein
MKTIPGSCFEVLDVLSEELEASPGSRISTQAQEKLNCYFDQKSLNLVFYLCICLISGYKKCESGSESGSGCTNNLGPRSGVNEYGSGLLLYHVVHKS